MTLITIGVIVASLVKLANIYVLTWKLYTKTQIMTNITII
jgi:hypothetical protein